MLHFFDILNIYYEAGLYYRCSSGSAFPSFVDVGQYWGTAGAFNARNMIKIEIDKFPVGTTLVIWMMQRKYPRVLFFFTLLKLLISVHHFTKKKNKNLTRFCQLIYFLINMQFCLYKISISLNGNTETNLGSLCKKYYCSWLCLF